MDKSIQNQKELIEAVRYIASETTKMVQKIVGKAFPIKSLTLFAHSQSEFESLTKILEKTGKPYDYNNGPRVELYEPIKVGENHITHLRIRLPDTERPQVGCNDFETDYETFKSEYLSKNAGNMNLIKRLEYEMIELHDKGFDVLAYVVSSKSRKTLKFRHHLAEEILQGRKNVTWRLFDDKDLKVWDKVELLYWETKERFADAEIIEVREKRLEEIEEKDFDGHEKFGSNEEMLETYRKYYGDKVNWDTALKIIKFKLLRPEE